MDGSQGGLDMEKLQDMFNIAKRILASSGHPENDYLNRIAPPRSGIVKIRASSSHAAQRLLLAVRRASEKELPWPDGWGRNLGGQ